jgi:hypothetical protein
MQIETLYMLMTLLIQEIGGLALSCYAIRGTKQRVQSQSLRRSLLLTLLLAFLEMGKPIVPIR